MLGLDDRWWEMNDRHDSGIALLLGGLNLFYVAAAAAGAVCLLWSARRRGTSRLSLPHWTLWLAFLVTRSLFLGSLENPEPRYTLECYPVILALAAVALAGSTRSQGFPSKPDF
jgi:peptidoglycan/LPS O-acetylase OafA/YrhL